MDVRTRRVLAALDGRTADRVPFMAWMHLATQHLDPLESARVHETFFVRYELDAMKVMNDYPYPLPAGIEQVDSPEAMRRFEPIVGTTTAHDDQLVVIRALRERLGPEVIILDTVFNPFGVAHVLLKQSLGAMIELHPADVQTLLDVIAESLRHYVRASLAAGSSGIFYSVNGATAALLPDEQFTAYVRSPDLHVLSACNGSTMNVCHAHGERPRLSDLLDYPVQAFSWSHLATTPTVSTFRTYSEACVIGGVDERLTIVRRQPSQIRSDVLATISEAGRNRCVVGPGCSLATETPVRLIDAARLAARQA